MKLCEFCGATLPEDASFCGNCGRIASSTSDHGTSFGELPTSHLEHDPNADLPTIAVESDVLTLRNSPIPEPPSPLILGPVEEKDEEEERRRRAALLGLGLPLLANQPIPNQIPTMQGTPSIGHVPTLQGTPTVQSGMPPSTAAQPPSTVLPKHYGPPHHPYPPKPGHPAGGSTGSTGGLSGCLTASMIIVATIVIILASVIGLGLTVWTPNLSLSGGSTVSPGGALTLHGNHFLPSSNVTLTLDSGTPLLFSQSMQLRYPSSAHILDGQSAASIAQAIHTFQLSQLTNVIAVGVDGSFTITVTIDATWTLGSHVIHATETLSHRNTSLTFTIGVPLTATPTLTPTLTPTPTPAPPTLSCAMPGQLNLGPVSELSSQVATGNVTLCAGGTGTLTWNASWDQNQAPWLQLNPANGTLQAPNETVITVAASAANLSAGTYTATITFTGQESQTTQTVTVSFTVQAGCINATPSQLRFSGVAGVSDPASTQDISLTNCGLANNWSAKITNISGNWLSINPQQGTLRQGGTTTITVTASNVKTKLKAGTYQGTIAITLGSQTINVLVQLTVQPAPTLSASPTSLNGASSPCVFNRNQTYSCTILLVNSSSTVPLTWTWSADVSGVTVQPDGATIPGGREQVIITFSTCTTTHVTFTGPSNQVIVTWACFIIS